jgi:hypothetical protein
MMTSGAPLSHEYDFGTWSATGRSSPNFVAVHAAVEPPPAPVVEVALAPPDEDPVSPVDDDVVALVALVAPPDPVVPAGLSAEEQATRPAEVIERRAREVIKARFTPPRYTS